MTVLNEAGEEPSGVAVTNNNTDNNDSSIVLSAQLNQQENSLTKNFFRVCLQAKGTKALICATLLLALGVGCTVGVLPDTISDRYARLNHGYTGVDCGSLAVKPAACQAGTDDAQAAAAWSNVALSLNALVFNPLVGSFSDLYGRRLMILASLTIQILPCAAFCALMMLPYMHPIWFYLTNSLIGGISFIGLTFAALSDTIPEAFRSSSYGLLVGVFYGGYALSPSLPLVLNHFHTAVASLVIVILGFVSALLFLPETLPEDVREAAREKRTRRDTPIENDGEDGGENADGSLQHLQHCLFVSLKVLCRPFEEMSILGRDKVLALLAAGSFFSSMVFASDATLVLYYIEDQLGVGDKDIASMFLLMGIAGLVLQGGAIQPSIRLMGERGLLIATFVCGTLHNFLYGIAKTKGTIFAALMVAQLTKLNTPILSSMASKDASREEQGRIQGALAASNAIAYSLGPLTMEFVYHHTKRNVHLGPGFMFYYAAMLYAVGLCLVSCLPSEVKRSEDSSQPRPDDLEQNSLEEPLLHETDETDN